MKKKQIIITLYLLLIASTLGAVLTLGILNAAVIFNSEYILPIPYLDHYNEGILMGEIFRRFSYWIYFMILVIAIFEAYEYKMMRRDRYAIIAAFITLSTMALFAAIYTPKILELQQQGVEATLSSEFASLHSASELDFKILAVALIALFVRRMMLMFR